MPGARSKDSGGPAQARVIDPEERPLKVDLFKESSKIHKKKRKKKVGGGRSFPETFTLNMYPKDYESKHFVYLKHNCHCQL